MAKGGTPLTVFKASRPHRRRGNVSRITFAAFFLFLHSTFLQFPKLKLLIIFFFLDVFIPDVYFAYSRSGISKVKINLYSAFLLLTKFKANVFLYLFRLIKVMRFIAENMTRDQI